MGGGDDFLEWFFKADRGQARPVRPGRRRLDPQREDQGRGLLGGVRHRPEHRPADHDLRVDRPAGAQGAGRVAVRHLRHLRRHPRDGRATRPAAWAWPTTSAGTGSRRPACRSSACPGCPVQPRQLHGDAALPALPGRRAGADDPARRRAAAARGCSARPSTRAATAAGYYEQGDFADRVRLAQVHRQARLLGPGGATATSPSAAGWRHRRLPQRRRHLHRLHHARLPRQVHAVHGRAARRAASRRRPVGIYGRADPRAAALHQQDREQGAEVAAQRGPS